MINSYLFSASNSTITKTMHITVILLLLQWIETDYILSQWCPELKLGAVPWAKSKHQLHYSINMQVWFQKEYSVCMVVMPQKILQAKLNLMVSHIRQPFLGWGSEAALRGHTWETLLYTNNCIHFRSWASLSSSHIASNNIYVMKLKKVDKRDIKDHRHPHTLERSLMTN